MRADHLTVVTNDGIFLGQHDRESVAVISEPIEEGIVDMAESPSREEINAKLEAAEARTEARFAELRGSIDTRFVSMESKMDRLIELNSKLSTEVGDVKSDNKNTRWTIVIIFVGSVIAALAALWSTQNNMLASFTAGLTALQVKQPINPPAQQSPPDSKRGQ